MKLKANDNGNVVAIRQHEVFNHVNFDNRSWLSNNTESNNTYNTQYDNSQFHSNFYDTRDITEVEATVTRIERFNEDSDNNKICNRQYRINTEGNGLYLKSLGSTQTTNLEESTETTFSRESFLGDANAFTNANPVDEDRAFELSDTDEMSENSLNPVPRGIVNPNYPGFQHLAHTLQDYSANIENFYPSENEMTDDDIDLEIADSNYDPETNEEESNVECKTIINNNNGNEEIDERISQTILPVQNDFGKQFEMAEDVTQNEIPDLLKTISANNNNIRTTDYETHCSDTDIENNFHTKDIIGDFNKEIEDEIKQLLNYNINIEDDLEELRKDIQDTFAKPIENTINNISDVVNHVIKKLVETHMDTSEQNDNLLPMEDTKLEKRPDEIIKDVNVQNEINARTEMNLSRPTFLLIEDSTHANITDAFLSDAKDEITVYESEYDTEALTNNVEKTIQQLSTELRKIIPKLDEMKERDKLWAQSKIDLPAVVIDGNSNEIAGSSKCCTHMPAVSIEHKIEVSEKPIFTQIKTINRTVSIATRVEPRPIKDRQRENPMKSSYRCAQGNTSVRKNDAVKDCDLDSFDVYNIETALPKLDLDAIESHLRAAKEAERRKRNDREEIRKRLAMGAEAEEYYSMGHIERPGKKPSLHSRLQNGKNLQICFMNETASDNESQASDVERNVSNKNSRSNIFTKSNFNHPYQTRPLSVNITKHDKVSTSLSGTKLRPTSLSTKTPKSKSSHSLGHIELKESDFYTLQATLQTEARVALAQAKELARVQMERERRSRAVSPVTEMLRRSMEKANAPLTGDRRRVSRQILTDMNIAQLQVIVNELHSQIECLNDSLVKMLMARDELHMSQDSMLVDIEDLTRYLGVKEQTKKTKGKSGVRRLASFVNK